jgi:hypothetical protein
MPNGKGAIAITEFYRDEVNATGWTNKWWTTAATLDEAVTSWQPVISARASLMCTTCGITQIRASWIDHPRDSFWYTPPNGRGTIPTTANPPLGPWEALLVRRDTSNHDVLGFLFMHGVPQTIFAGRNYDPTASYGPTWEGDMTNWLAALIAAAALIRKGPKPGTFVGLANLTSRYKTRHAVGRPFDPLRGRRRIA